MTARTPEVKRLPDGFRSQNLYSKCGKEFVQVMAADRPWKAWVDALTPEQKQELHDQLEKKDRLTIDEMRIVYYLEGMNDGKVNALEELLGEDSNSAVITPYHGPPPNRKD